MIDQKKMASIDSEDTNRLHQMIDPEETMTSNNRYDGLEHRVPSRGPNQLWPNAGDDFFQKQVPLLSVGPRYHNIKPNILLK